MIQEVPSQQPSRIGIEGLRRDPSQPQLFALVDKPIDIVAKLGIGRRFALNYAASFTSSTWRLPVKNSCASLACRDAVKMARLSAFMIFNHASR